LGIGIWGVAIFAQLRKYTTIAGRVRREGLPSHSSLGLYVIFELQVKY